mgnify:CR=1
TTKNRHNLLIIKQFQNFSLAWILRGLKIFSTRDTLTVVNAEVLRVVTIWGSAALGGVERIIKNVKMLSC